MGGRHRGTCHCRMCRGMGRIDVRRAGWRRHGMHHGRRRRRWMGHGRGGRRRHRPMKGLGRRMHFAGRHGHDMRRLRHARARRGGSFNSPRYGLAHPDRRHRSGYSSFPRALVRTLRLEGRHRCRRSWARCRRGFDGSGRLGVLALRHRRASHHGGSLRRSRVLRRLRWWRPAWRRGPGFGRTRRRSRSRRGRGGAVPGSVRPMEFMELLDRSVGGRCRGHCRTAARFTGWSEPLHPGGLPGNDRAMHGRQGRGGGHADRGRPPCGGLRRYQGLPPGRRRRVSTIAATDATRRITAATWAG